MMAGVTLAGEGAKGFAWKPRLFIFEIKLTSLDHKDNICLFLKTENRQNYDEEKNTHSPIIQKELLLCFWYNSSQPLY